MFCSDVEVERLVSYVRYLPDLVPTGLAAYYPHPLKPLPMEYVAPRYVFFWESPLRSGLPEVLSFLAAGWIWYFVTLLPDCIIQVGAQSMADRYTYIPSESSSQLSGKYPQCRFDEIADGTHRNRRFGGDSLSWMAWKQADIGSTASLCSSTVNDDEQRHRRTRLGLCACPKW
jgi:hypothetical protein